MRVGFWLSAIPGRRLFSPVARTCLSVSSGRVPATRISESIRRGRIDYETKPTSIVFSINGAQIVCFKYGEYVGPGGFLVESRLDGEMFVIRNCDTKPKSSHFSNSMDDRRVHAKNRQLSKMGMGKSAPSFRGALTAVRAISSEVWIGYCAEKGTSRTQRGPVSQQRTSNEQRL
jgi:hypothetical protein